MNNFLNKQKQLLDLAHVLWDSPGDVFHISDSYWSLRVAYLEDEPDVQAFNELSNLACRELIVLQTRLRKAEKLVGDVL